VGKREILPSLNPENIQAVIKEINKGPFFKDLSMTVKELGIGSSTVLMNVSKKHLNPFGGIHGGVYAFVIDTAAYWAVYCELDERVGYGFWSPNKYYGFLNTFKYDEESVVLEKYTIVESKRSRTVCNWLQYFAPEELEREFVEAGFSVEGLYSDVTGPRMIRTRMNLRSSPRRHRPARNDATHPDGNSAALHSRRRCPRYTP
jgi:acyl-coenzyme A thioesterase PaaI-like protein